MRPAHRRNAVTRHGQLRACTGHRGLSNSHDMVVAVGTFNLAKTSQHVQIVECLVQLGPGIGMYG